MTRTKDLLGVFLGLILAVYMAHDFMSIVPIPVSIQEDPVKIEAERCLIKAEAPVKRIPVLTHAVTTASKSTEFSPAMIVALMKSESSFKKEAVSPTNKTGKRFKGEMQTEWASQYSDVNVLLGARELENKMRIAGGDIVRALSLYKGGDNPEARKYAQQTLKLYRYLKEA